MSGGTSDDTKDSVGWQGLFGANTDINRHAFQAEQLEGERRTHFAAKIVAVYGGGLGSAPTVDIQPIVKTQDGLGNGQSHGTIYGVKVSRQMAGDSVIINDPVVNDIGWFSVADRDHSSAAENDWQEANPGSARRGSMSDAVMHGVQHPERVTPKQWIMFTPHGVEVQDRNNNTLKGSSSGWNMNGVIITSKGEIQAPGNITAGQGTGDQVTLQNHVHPNVPKPTPGS